jgi:hypothetical protein
MKRVDYMAVAEKAMAQIRPGAFLTVKSGEALNTMTIGWATIGYVWGKPIFWGNRGLLRNRLISDVLL